MAQEILLSTSPRFCLPLDYREKSPSDDAFFQACSCTHDPDILPTVKELMRLKMENLELKAGKRLDIINEYID